MMSEFITNIDFDHDIAGWASILSLLLAVIGWIYAFHQRKKYKRICDLIRGGIVTAQAVRSCRELSRLLDYRKFGDARDRMRETSDKIIWLSENHGIRELLAEDQWVEILTYISDIGNQINTFEYRATASNETKG